VTKSSGNTKILKQNKFFCNFPKFPRNFSFIDLLNSSAEFISKLDEILPIPRPSSNAYENRRTVDLTYLLLNKKERW
jgi:hypothetical protein